MPELASISPRAGYKLLDLRGDGCQGCTETFSTSQCCIAKRSFRAPLNSCKTRHAGLFTLSVQFVARKFRAGSAACLPQRSAASGWRLPNHGCLSRWAWSISHMQRGHRKSGVAGPLTYNRSCGRIFGTPAHSVGHCGALRCNESGLPQRSISVHASIKPAKAPLFEWPPMAHASEPLLPEVC